MDLRGEPGRAIPLDDGSVLIESRTRGECWHRVTTGGAAHCTCEWWKVHLECAHYDAAIEVAVGRRTMKREFIVEAKGGKEAILYAGLVDQAHDEGLKVITTQLLQIPTPENGHTAIVHAHVETEKGIFEGLGDANPGNVTRMVAGHLIRMAETRAKARALRDAINVGTVAVEEIDEDDDAPDAASSQPQRSNAPAGAQRQQTAEEQPRSGASQQQPKQTGKTGPLCPIHQEPTRINMAGTKLGHDTGDREHRGWCDLENACRSILQELMTTYTVTLANIDQILTGSGGAAWADRSIEERATVLPKIGDWLARRREKQAQAQAQAEPVGAA